MSPVRNKRESSKKVPEITENKRLPAYKRQPELYYAHVWLDKEIFTQVLAYIGWEKEQKYSMSRLRQKIEIDPANHKIITTVPKTGYIFNKG